MKYPVSFVCDLSVIDFVKLGYRQDLGLVEKTSAVLSVDCQYWSQSQPSNWTLRPRYATLTKRLVDFQLKLGFPPSCRMARCRGTHEYDRGHRAGPVKFNMSEQPLLACMSRKKQYHQKNNEFKLTDFSNPSITNHSIGKAPHNSAIFAGHFGSKALGVKKTDFLPASGIGSYLAEARVCWILLGPTGRWCHAMADIEVLKFAPCPWGKMSTQIVKLVSRHKRFKYYAPKWTHTCSIG